MILLNNFAIFGFLSIVTVTCTARTPESTREFALKHLLPSKNDCGLQNVNGDFPWVTFLSCEDSDGPRASSTSSDVDFAVTSRDCDCSGVLISEQYILTSGNCASAKWAGLGQHEQNSNKNCTITTSSDNANCSPPKSPFTEQILHPDNTILLLRLTSKIAYSDQIRPICLPIDGDDQISNEDNVLSSNWNIDTKAGGLVRSEISHTIQSNENCANNFEIFGLKNSPKYMCTATAKLLCKTDSGSPIMYKRNTNWFLGGILHAEICLENSAIGNRVTPEIFNWILENMKP